MNPRYITFIFALAFLVLWWTPRDVFAAPPILTWEKYYNLGGTTPSLTQNIAVDSSGNVYVAGRYPSWGTRLIKYDSAGNLIWTTTVNEGGIFYTYNSGVAISGDNLYLGMCIQDSTNRTYSGQSKFLTRKYNPATGGVVWERAYRSPSLSCMSDIAADPSGNAYASGSYFTSSGDHVARTIKYDLNGNIVWNVTYNPTPPVVSGGLAANYDVPQANAVDIHGNLYELLSGQDGKDLIVMHYRENGSVIKTKKLDFIGADIAVDSSLNVYVTPLLSVWTGSMYESRVVKYGFPDFNFFWDKIIPNL